MQLWDISEIIVRRLYMDHPQLLCWILLNNIAIEDGPLFIESFPITIGDFPQLC